MASNRFQHGETTLADLGIRVLDQHRRLPVAAIRDERIVRVELALDAGLLQ